MSIELYSLNFTPTTGEYIIQKFDTDYSCESVYALTLTNCMCPQGHKDSCRHRKMLGDFLKHGHIGDGWFLEWQTRLWRRPVNDISEGTSLASPLDSQEVVCKATSSAGEETKPTAVAPPPPPPPEGPTSLSPGAATASPVGAVATIKRRKV